MSSLGGFDPSSNGVFGVLPFPGHRGGAARCKPIMQQHDRCKRVRFSGLNCGRNVCGEKLCGQAANQVPCMVKVAYCGGAHDGSAIPGLQKAVVVAHSPTMRS